MSTKGQAPRFLGERVASGLFKATREIPPSPCDWVIAFCLTSFSALNWERGGGGDPLGRSPLCASWFHPWQASPRSSRCDLWQPFT